LHPACEGATLEHPQRIAKQKADALRTPFACADPFSDRRAWCRTR
jgi:hypothetical protein